MNNNKPVETYTNYEKVFNYIIQYINDYSCGLESFLDVELSPLKYIEYKSELKALNKLYREIYDNILDKAKETK